MNNISVAIIIPVKQFNDRLKICLDKCLELKYSNFEILVLPDEQFSGFNEKIKVIPTGPVGPALKRDMALQYSKAEIFAFLDDDAYPDPDWIKNAVKHFEKEEVAAVGGPSVTPPESTLAQAASGLALSSIIVSGPYTYRYVPGKKVMEVDDYPSCNFIVRRGVFAELGGFDNKFWPGEDTKLCLEITKKLNKKIIYDPDVLVYHHRRKLGPAHFRQVANYALHRGYFAKRFPETSRKLSYFIPTLFVAYLLAGSIISFYNAFLGKLFKDSIFAYIGIVIFASLKEIIKSKNSSFLSRVLLLIPVAAGIVLTHIAYGIFLVKGLLTSKLKEEVET